MDTESVEIPKRKIEDLLEDEPPDKKRCSENGCSLYDKEINAPDSEKVENTGIIKSPVEGCDANTSHAIVPDSPQIIDSENKTREIKSSSTPENGICNQVESPIERKVNKDNDKTEEENQEENLTSRQDLNSVIENGDNSKVANKSPVVDTVQLSPTSSQTIGNTAQAAINLQVIPREKCRYGAQCYRLNAEHKANFSHPGDADYDQPDNRPECPYGIKCYRKNAQHKLDYKHTRDKRKQKKAPPGQPILDDLSDFEDYEDESVDESEYEPSFIDDESLDELDSNFEDDDGEGDD